MANNPYVNKVVYGDTALIDISDTTAVASDVAQGKYFYTANGAKVEGTASGGGTAAISVVDTTDPVAGGTIRTITALDISDTTATASDVASGKYFYTAGGTKTAGTASGGGGGSSKKQIYFIDYDGTILHSYTKTEWQSVSSLPSNPSHTGLTAQGWNWTKAEIDAQLTAIPNEDVWVGQMYITAAGTQRIYIHLEESRLHPYLGICPNGTVVVDWGDNSVTDTLTGTSLTTVQYANHTYTSSGDYMLTLTVSSGSFAFYGVSNTSHILKKDTGTTANIHKVYTNAIQKIELGQGACIGNYAFQNCYSLSSITIPNTVTSIGSNAFYYCYSLESVTIPNTLTNIGGDIFCYCYSLSSITIPSGVTSISSNAFYGCYSLSSITIPSGVTSIGSYAFYACYSLSSITIPSGVTYISDYVFSNCYSLSNITIPGGVTSIGSYAFRNCSSLSSITIPSGVTSISSSAFYSCYSLSSITIPSGVTSIGSSAFYYCYSLESITIPNTVTSIGASAFYACQSLSSITIPSGVTSIEGSAFYGCQSLSSITIPSGVTSIGTNAFYYCQSLSSITIPSGVTSIGTTAFANCYGMAEYHIKPTTVPTLVSGGFSNIQSDCVIYVPSAKLTDYQTADNWSMYASYMQGE